MKRFASIVVVAVGVAFFFSPILACKKKEDDRLVVRLLLVDVAPDARSASGPIEREAVRKQIQSLLANDARISLREGTRASAGKGATLRVRLSAASPLANLTPRAAKPAVAVDDNKHSGVLQLTVDASNDQGTTPGASFHYKGSSTSDTSGAMPLSSVIEQSFRQALDQVLLARRARDLDDKTLLSWLQPESTSSGDQRRQAIRVLGARKSHAALPALIRILGSKDRALSVHALGALSSIEPAGDVDRLKVAIAIIEYAEAKSTIIRKQAIVAVGRIDTRMSRAWLWTMSSGHPDSDVQRRALLALAALDDTVLADDPAQLAERGIPRTSGSR